MESNIDNEILLKIRKDIGNQLIAFREKQKLTQVQLSEKMGVAPTTISRVEGGKWSVSLDTLATFAHYLNFTIKLEPNE